MAHLASRLTFVSSLSPNCLDLANLLSPLSPPRPRPGTHINDYLWCVYTYEFWLTHLDRRGSPDTQPTIIVIVIIMALDTMHTSYSFAL